MLDHWNPCLNSKSISENFLFWTKTLVSYFLRFLSVFGDSNIKTIVSNFFIKSYCLESQILDFSEVSGPNLWLSICLFSKVFQTVIFIYWMFFNLDCFTILRDCFLVTVDMFGQFVSHIIRFCLVLITMLAWTCS